MPLHDGDSTVTDKMLRIGGACGFWGEADHATAQLLTDPQLDVLVYDYLAEITLSIMARARKADAATGYAPDFVHRALAPNIEDIARRGVKVLSNAGGMNPHACADAVRDVVAERGLSLKVAVVEGDDLLDRIDDLAQTREMFSDAPFPDKDRILSANAYLGAVPVVAALNAGADIVVTGRCADSALTLAAAMHAFGWPPDAFDLLSAGSLAGHLLECGPQATGGNFTDWQHMPDRAHIGYPIAAIRADGTFTLEKPDGTGGLISRESVGEQMLYEIGDPQAYLLPDVICDWSDVRLAETPQGHVEVSGASGRAPTGLLKVSVTHEDGFRAGQVLNFNGQDAREKGRAYADAVFVRVKERLARMGADDFDEVAIEFFGGQAGPEGYEEVAMTVAVRHRDAAAVTLLLKELIGAALATPPGLHFFTGAGRPKPSPIVALFSCLVDAGLPDVSVTVEGVPVTVVLQSAAEIGEEPRRPDAPEPPSAGRDLVSVPLEQVAVARSGDKGDAANIGVMARAPEFMPWIWAAVTPEAVAEVFAREVRGPVERFYLPGSVSMNLLLHRALGGGGISSLRNDSQGKSFAQRLLSMPVDVPSDLLGESTKGISR